MILDLKIKKLPNSQVEIVGEIPAEDFEKTREEAIKEISKNVKIDGFRPGNIPEKVLIDKAGEGAVLENMAERAIRQAYPEIIEENDIKAIGRPEIVITKIAKNNPLGFKIKTNIIPEIELPDYKKIAKSILSEKEKIVVEYSEIDTAIENVRKSRATKNDKDEEVLPELTDDFVKQFGDFKTVDDFKKKVEEGLIEDKTVKEKEKRQLQVLEKINDSSKMEIPEILIEAEKNKMLNEMKHSIGQMGLKWEDYVKHLKKTEEEIMKEWDKDALKRISFNLILGKISELEGIEVSEKELDEEADKIVESYKKSGQEVDKNRAKLYLGGVLKNKKVFEFLEENK